MLNPPNPAKKNFSEEDSSGSDAGSEVSLEPETDRFGFIVTNGSTPRHVGPHPHLVRQREAKWISIMEHWNGMLLKKSSKVKVQCQKGIPASLRAKCWPLLCGATERMKHNQHLYETLDSQLALQNWVDLIERDLDRQFPFHEMFQSKDGHGQRGLFRVLKAYTQYEPEEGYCQAQGPVAAVLLMNMPAEEAFWCLVQISKQYLPGYYSPLLEGVLFDAAMLTLVLKRTCPAAHKHLQQHSVEPLMFATDWLMCLFTRHLPFNTLLRVWDLFFCNGVRVLLQVAVVLVRRVLGRAEQRKQCQGQMETLERLRGVREEVPDDDDDSFVSEVCAVPLSARDLERQTEKALETWRKDRPASTFDPRGRCHGYRMAWARAQFSAEERDRRERQTGNLSLPLARSASLLSLSPSMLRKKFMRGGKSKEWEGGGGGIVRHLSMGAREDCRSWDRGHFKREQDVQEEEEHEKHSEVKPTEPSKELEPQMSNEPQEAAVDVTIKQQTDFAEKYEGGQSESEESKSPLQQMPTTEETPAKTGETLTPEAHSAEEIPDSEDQSQASIEEEREAESDQQAELQTREGLNPSQEVNDIKSEAETENLPQLDQVREVASEADAQTGHETHEGSPALEEEEEEEEAEEVDAPTVTHAELTAESQQEQEQEQVEHDGSSQGGSHPAECQSAESLSETDGGEEPLPHTATETDILAQTQEAEREDVETRVKQDQAFPLEDAETETVAPPSDECVKDGEDCVGNMATDDGDEKESDKTSEDLIENPDTALTVNSPTEPQADVVEVFPAEPVGKTSPEPTQQDPHEQPESPVPVEKSTDAQNKAGEDDVFTAPEPTAAPRLDPHPPKEARGGGPARGSRPSSSSLSSGDVCVRRPSSSRGSRLARGLSEDLFTSPQKTPQSSRSQSEGNPGTSTADSVQAPPDPSPLDPPKHFSLFRRLKGEHPKKAKEKPAPKMQVPKILIQDFSEKVGSGGGPQEEGEEKLSSRERRRRRREQERREKEEERQRKRREKELKKEVERERRKPQTRGKSFQAAREKGDAAQPANPASKNIRYSDSYAESYF